MSESSRTPRIVHTALLMVTSAFGAGPATVAHANDVTFAFSGTVSDVVATHHPLCDCAPFELTIDPAFTEAFFAGLPVEGTFTFQSHTPDGIANPGRGQYTAIRQGSIQVGGENYRIGQGVIQVDADPTYTPRTDHLTYYSYTAQEITEPIAAGAVQFDLAFRFAAGLTLESDRLPLLPPREWSSGSAGYLYFDTGILTPYQGVRFSVDSIQRIPEPGSALMALVAGAAFAGMLRVLR